MQADAKYKKTSLMQIHLNGWQRIGVFLSVLWILLAGCLAIIEYADSKKPIDKKLIASGYLFFKSHQVKFDPPPDTGRVKRFLSYEEAFGYRSVHEFRPVRLISAIFVPILLFWIIAYISVFAFRWIAAGFRNKP